MCSQTTKQVEDLLTLIDKNTHTADDILFSEVLKQLSLDNSEASLVRLGNFLTQSRAKGWYINAILNKTGGLNLLIGLAAYIGRYIAKQVDATPVWLNYDEATKIFAHHELPAEFFTSLVVDIQHFIVLPLGAISDYLSQHVTEQTDQTITVNALAEYAKTTIKKINSSQNRDEGDWCSLYLHHYHQGIPIPGGLAYKDRLNKLNLDGSMASIIAIDGLLDELSAELDNTEAGYVEFINHEPKGNFLLLLGFYLGTQIAKQAQSCIKWFNYDTAKDMLDDGFVHVFEHNQSFILLERIHFPLYPIVFKLFPFLTETNSGKGHQKTPQTCHAYAQQVIAHEQGYLTSYDRQAMQEALPKPIPITWQQAMSAAGFLAAMSADSAFDGHHLSPRKIVPNGADQSKSDKLTIIDGMFMENAIDSFYQDINLNQENQPFQVFCYDMYANLPTGRTDGIAIEIRCYGDNPLSLQLVQPYRHANKPEGFALYPVVTNQAHVPNSIHELVNEFYTAALDFKSPFNGDFWQRYYLPTHDIFASITETPVHAQDLPNTHNEVEHADLDIAQQTFQPLQAVVSDFLPMGNASHLSHYLTDFLHNKPLDDGLRFEKQLRACKLDFSMASLQRLDKFLVGLNAHFYKMNPDKAMDSIDELTKNASGKNLLCVIMVYVTEVVGRLLGQAPRWFVTDAFSDTGLFVNRHAFSSFFVLFNRQLDTLTLENALVFQPMQAIIGQLGGELVENMAQTTEQMATEQTERKTTIVQSVHALLAEANLLEANQLHTGFTIKQGHIDTPSAPIPPPPPLALPINISQQIDTLKPQQRHYLQIIAPYWLIEDKLVRQMQQLPTLYRKGRVVWGALIQANNLLFSPENPSSCPGEVLYDPTGRTEPSVLMDTAHQLFTLKTADITETDQQAYANHLKDERTRTLGMDCPNSISTLPLKMSSMYFWRVHLPNAMLSLSYFPILIHDDCDGAITLLPARFWSKDFYQRWLDSAQQEHGDNFDILPSILAKEQSGDHPFVNVTEDVIENTYPNLSELFPNHQTEPSALSIQGDKHKKDNASHQDANTLFMHAMHVIKNPKKHDDAQFLQAFADLEQAAQQNHIRAKRELGWLYLCGIADDANADSNNPNTDPNTDKREAGFAMLLQAAHANDAKAQMLMASLHLQDGDGQHAEEGYEWLIKAADNGDKDAQEMLDAILAQDKPKTSWFTWGFLIFMVLSILGIVFLATA